MVSEEAIHLINLMYLKYSELNSNISESYLALRFHIK